MRIKVQTDENMFAVGRCPFCAELIAGGRSCKLFCKYHIANDYRAMEVECGFPQELNPHRENPSLKKKEDKAPIVIGVWNEED